jgi:uncharacterized tellurite resistance protein B-like protein
VLNRVTRWLGGEKIVSEVVDDGLGEVRICAAALLVEAAWLDGEFTDDERATISSALQRQFGLNSDEAASLLSEAETLQESAIEISRFTRAIKSMPEERRVEILEALWEVVLADGELHAYEANLLRRVGGLIYVSDRENGEARQRVMARKG